MPPQNRPFDTRILDWSEPGAVERAARLIAEGQPVGVPTETVYGLAADATNETAVARVYAAKGRPGFNPLIVHVPDLEAAERYASFDYPARAVARRFWPGAVTLVLPLREGSGIAPRVTAGLRTLALRCPAHPAMQALLAACRRPLAAPSANASGRISPTTAEHVLRTLGGRIPLVLDGGPSGQGLESTIVAVRPEGVRRLRPGPVPLSDVAAAAGLVELQGSGQGVEAPGQLTSHYAPTKPLRLDTTEAAPDEWLIGFGAVAGDETLSASGSLEQAAVNLFGALHRAEEQERPRIAVAPIPPHGIGAAIADRLRRAAAGAGR